MIQDLSSDVKKFLLSYNSIHQLIRLAQSELDRINGLLEAEIASQDWFSSVDFQTEKSHKRLQVWKKNWHPSVNPRCPWVHYEYTLSWPEQWVQASVDIESVKIASWEAVLDVAEQLHKNLLSEKPSLLEGQGWLLRSPLEGKRMLLVKRKNISESEFSGEWIFSTGIELFKQLSQITPLVDQTVEELFSE